MRPLLLVSTLVLSAFLLPGCSDDPSAPGGIPDAGGIPPDSGEPQGDAAICAVPPDFRTGDAVTYRYTDASGAAMDISLDVAGDTDGAIVFDVTEGDAVYRAAVSTYCNDTLGLDPPGNAPAPEMQPLFEQFASRPLLREIVMPNPGKFDEAMDDVLEDGLDPACEQGPVTDPISGTGDITALTCTYTYDPDVAGSTVTVRSVIAESRAEMPDFNRLIEKRETDADGSVRSLVLVSFDEAG